MQLTPDEIEKVWQKARIIPNNNPNSFRKDYAGAWIHRDEYGKASEYGWEIEHFIPLSMGGTNDIDNLIPVQHSNNLMRADKYPNWQTAVSADNKHNVESIRNWYSQ